MVEKLKKPMKMTILRNSKIIHELLVKNFLTTASDGKK